MIRRRRFSSLPVAVSALTMSLILAACSSAATVSPSTEVAATPTEASSAAPSESLQAATPTEAPSASPVAAATPEPSFDVSAFDKALKAVSTLDSYQADLTTSNVSSTIPEFSATAIIVRKGDPSESELITEAGVLKFGVVYIKSAGNGWVNQGKGWTKVPLPAATSMLSSFSFLDPGVLLASFLTDKVRPYLQTVGSESKNGTDTTHFHVEASNLPSSSTFPPDGVADVWVSADGKYLVAAAFSGTEKGVKKTFDYELTHINDSSLKVKPPV